MGVEADRTEVRVVVVPPAGVDQAVVFARDVGWQCATGARRDDGRVTLTFERELRGPSSDRSDG